MVNNTYRNWLIYHRYYGSANQKCKSDGSKMIKRIDFATLEALASGGAVREVVVMRHNEGYILDVKIGMNTMRLRSQREDTKVFKSLDTLAKHMRQIGIHQVSLDLA